MYNSHLGKSSKEITVIMFGIDGKGSISRVN